MWALPNDEAKRGVVTPSSGNHGAALALADRTRDIPAHIVVPDGAVEAKIANIKRAGGIVHRCALTQAAREEMRPGAACNRRNAGPPVRRWPAPATRNRCLLRGIQSRPSTVEAGCFRKVVSRGSALKYPCAMTGSCTNWPG